MRAAVGRRRIETVAYECRSFRAALENLEQRRRAQDAAARAREELLHRRFAPNDATAVPLDAMLKEHTGLSAANTGLDHLIHTGAEIMESLQSQHGTMKGAQRRLLDIANTLGMSATVMRFIERRTRQDVYLMLVGMLVTMALLWVIARH